MIWIWIAGFLILFVATGVRLDYQGLTVTGRSLSAQERRFRTLTGRYVGFVVTYREGLGLVNAVGALLFPITTIRVSQQVDKQEGGD